MFYFILISHCILPVWHSKEPGSEADIKVFAARYGVQFDMYSKVDVNGSNTHPLYKYLKSHISGSLGSFVKWNFEKVRVWVMDGECG